MDDTKVKIAFGHIKGLYPEITQVFFNSTGGWFFCNECFEGPEFDERVNIDLLEDAVESIDNLPYAYGEGVQDEG